MTPRKLPKENEFANSPLNSGWRLEEEIGRGKIGVVYRATKTVSGFPHVAAVKLVAAEDMKTGWQIEIEKAQKLTRISQAVQYKECHTELIAGAFFVCIFQEFVNGQNLRQYLKTHPESVTLAFLRNLLEQILRAFLAMSCEDIRHGDLHEGNILIAIDPRLYENEPVILVNDFGIGGSHNKMNPKDDYVQLALICQSILRRFIDPASLGGAEDRRYYDFLVDEFLPKYVLEQNPTTGDFVRNPRRLLGLHNAAWQELRQVQTTRPHAVLDHPFDYLSCEQMGDSFELLQNLYSSSFPGYSEILQRSNTIVTGPRGCGKTTIFRNHSLRAKLLSRRAKIDSDERFLGIYYHCRDLFFAFHFSKTKNRTLNQQLLTHYFCLALLREVIDTLILVQDLQSWQLDAVTQRRIEEFFKKASILKDTPPQGTSTLRHVRALIEEAKHRVSLPFELPNLAALRMSPLTPEIVPQFCELLQECVFWLQGKAIYFFLDDYSMPHITREMQQCLNDVIMYRWSSCFFKISSESITSFHPCDSSGKLVEATREYDVIDLGSYFIRSPAVAKDDHDLSAERNRFLVEVINNRLKNSSGIHEENRDIRKLLGYSQYKSHNELARAIREAPQKQAQYAGIDTLTDLFSGDIADMLRIVRDIFTQAGVHERLSQPGLTIDREYQDKAIRGYGNGFLNRIEAAPKTGKKLRSIAEAFGGTANWLLKNRNSKNQAQNPPWQAFRIEVKDTLTFDETAEMQQMYTALVAEEDRAKVPLAEFVEELETNYRDLLKYGVFIRDVRGKSQRGAVVPRLYLRRLLIPSFVLSTSQRDSVGLERREFWMLLYAPEKFLRYYVTKKPAESQRDLFDDVPI